MASDAELTRVLRNVLVNAVIYSPPGATVVLSAAADGATAVLAVQDGCGGIPDADLQHVFVPGYRGEPARTPGAQAGAGLGLAIARALTEAQGGTVTLHNAGAGLPGRGHAAGRLTVTHPVVTSHRLQPV